eukprot:3936053-Rhodomonas_salina.1
MWATAGGKVLIDVAVAGRNPEYEKKFLFYVNREMLDSRHFKEQIIVLQVRRPPHPNPEIRRLRRAASRSRVCARAEGGWKCRCLLGLRVDQTGCSRKGTTPQGTKAQPRYLARSAWASACGQRLRAGSPAACACSSKKSILF